MPLKESKVSAKELIKDDSDNSTFCSRLAQVLQSIYSYKNLLA
jgi:hypothetical protein